MPFAVSGNAIALHIRWHQLDRGFPLYTYSPALLPLFASLDYTQKIFSSTVLSSLAAGTPLLVDGKFLAAYTFLNTSTTYHFHGIQGEDLADAMQRLLRTPTPEVVKVGHGAAALFLVHGLACFQV